MHLPLLDIEPASYGVPLLLIKYYILDYLYSFHQKYLVS